MKTWLSALTMVWLALASRSALADTGPYYVSYPGYCNVKKVYINTLNDIYGTEIGCTAVLGGPLMGTFSVNGTVYVSTVVNGNPCMTVYAVNGTLGGGCSGGGPIAYNPNSFWALRQEFRPGTGARSIEYSVGTELPDLEKVKNLPQLP